MDFRLAVLLFGLLDGRPSIEQDVVERLKASFLLICGDAPVCERGEHGLIVLMLQPVAGGRQGIQATDQPPPPSNGVVSLRNLRNASPIFAYQRPVLPVACRAKNR